VPPGATKPGQTSQTLPSGRVIVPAKQRAAQASTLSEDGGAQAGVPAPRSKRARPDVSSFWQEGHRPELRNVAPSEAHVDFPAHDREFNRAEAGITRVLSDAKHKTIGRMADAVANALKSGVKPSEIAFRRDPNLHQAILGEIQKTYDFGRKQAIAEHARLMQRAGKVTKFADYATGFMLADPAARKPPKSLIVTADVAAEDFENRLADAARNVANDLRAKYADDFASMDAGELADQTFGAIDDYAEGFIARAAMEASRKAMGAGRKDGFDEVGDEAADAGAVFERTEMVDSPNICDNCEPLDGEQGPTYSSVDEDVCEGGALCRKIITEVFA